MAALVAAAEEEEVRMEVEAMQAVYGDDCRVIRDFPPRLRVHIKPRTADDSSQQFVEAILGIELDGQYPKEPPRVYIADMKGLDVNRQMLLVTGIEEKSRELASCLMLVALCEEAVEILSNMNHPEGNCPFCLYPLDDDGKPFMKLMSCYHCFHSECFIGWWKWLQDQSEIDSQEVAQCCPVCREAFDEKDVEHVLGRQASSASIPRDKEGEEEEEETVSLHSESENTRRQIFELVLSRQKEVGGLIEPRKEIAIAPGMYLPVAPPPPAELPTPATADGDDQDSSCSTTAAAPSSSSTDAAPSSSSTAAGPSSSSNSNAAAGVPRAPRTRRSSSSSNSSRSRGSRRRQEVRPFQTRWAEKESHAR